MEAKLTKETLVPPKPRAKEFLDKFRAKVAEPVFPEAQTRTIDPEQCMGQLGPPVIVFLESGCARESTH